MGGQGRTPAAHRRDARSAGRGTRPRPAPAGMMARQARVTSLIKDRRQAHDHQAPCLFLVTTRPSGPHTSIAGHSKFKLLSPATSGKEAAMQTRLRGKMGAPALIA